MKSFTCFFLAIFLLGLVALGETQTSNYHAGQRFIGNVGGYRAITVLEVEEATKFAQAHILFQMEYGKTWFKSGIKRDPIWLDESNFVDLLNHFGCREVK
jgi:hypothetical protein